MDWIYFVWKNDGLGVHDFALMNYVTDIFLERAIIKILRTSFQQNPSKVPII